jgi:hypothetical protein
MRSTMFKLFSSISVVLLLAACGSTPKNDYDRRAEAKEAADFKSNKTMKDKMPKWYTSLPQVNNAILSPGVGVSKNWASAIDKAKMDAYKSICMAKDGQIGMTKESFTSDVNSTLVEKYDSAVKASCKSVKVRGVEIARIDKEESIVIEHLPNNNFVAFVLIALPTGDANVIQTEHNKQELSRDAAKRAEKMLGEL